MSAETGLLVLAAYFGLLLLVGRLSRFRGSKGLLSNFFLAGRHAPWLLVAFGMIGTSLSGLTFLSVPGNVKNAQMAYLQTAVGYLLGYITIAYVLLPLFYRLKLTSIYGYLGQRMGPHSYLTGAWTFLISRGLLSAARLYLLCGVLQQLVFGPLGVPYVVNIALVLILTVAYSARGGLGTIVYTDTFQTLAMLGAMVITVIIIGSNLQGISLWDATLGSAYGQIVHTDPAKSTFWLKELVGGALITICMTGLDQDQIQKNLTLRRVGLAQRGMVSYGTTLVLVNALFLALGALLYVYADVNQLTLPTRTDQVYGYLAFNHLGAWVAALFLIGLVAAAFSSADGALAAMTTTACVDLYGVEKHSRYQGTEGEARAWRLKQRVYTAITIASGVLVLGFKLSEQFQSKDFSAIRLVLDLGTYTYGPLLGLFAFGMFTRRSVRDAAVPFISVAAPLLCLALKLMTTETGWLGNYKIGYELLLVNGLLVYVGCMAFSKK